MSTTATLRAPSTTPVAKTKRTATPAPLTGLCATCENAKTCTLPRSAEYPVLHCDEAALPEVKVESPFGHTVTPAPAAETEPALTGLCVNCDNRATCMLPKSEGGVWRCEEYA